MAFLKNSSSNKLFPLSWTLLTIILLCLPGGDIPGTGFFAIKGLDKIVHFMLFGGIVLLWGQYVRRIYPPKNWKRLILLSAIFSIGLGVALEYIQRYFIVGRSFDTGDILADAAGSLTLFIYHLCSMSTKKPL